MDSGPKLSRYQAISTAAQSMLALGESGRYEFKRDASVVTPRLLATLANWVALGPSRDLTQLLIGVDEVEDEATGLVWGRPCGLPWGLDKSVARVQDMASKTRPIPIDAFIVEENVAGDEPSIRVEIRPTMPPHFDDEGRRQTRQGRSTRALTDDELLRIYLDREAGSFAARFRQTGDELRMAVGSVGGQVDEIAATIEEKIASPVRELARTAQDAAEAADMAASVSHTAAASADSAEYETRTLQGLVHDLKALIEDIQEDSPPILAHRVAQLRRKIWWEFTADTWTHVSARSERLRGKLHKLLSAPISLEVARNSWEARIWEEVRKDRISLNRPHATQKWWDFEISIVSEFMVVPQYATPDLPDLRAALLADLDHELDDPTSITRQFEALVSGS